MRLLWIAVVCTWAMAARADDAVETLVLRAESSSPALASRRAQIAEVDALREVSRAWSDPVLTVGAMNLPLQPAELGGMAMTGAHFGIAQRLPTSGVPRRAGEVADARLVASAHAEAEAALQIGLAVRVGWWRLALVRQLRGVLARHLEAADTLLGAVRARYEVGAVGQGSVLRLELLRDALREDMADLARDEVALLASLARSVAAPELSVDSPAETSPLPVRGDPASWLAQAERARPLLAELDAEIAMAEAEAAMARAMGAPDVTLGASYLARVPVGDMPAGSDLVSFEVMVPVPLASSRVARGRRAAALHDAYGARARRAETSLVLRAELESAHARWTRAVERAERLASPLVPEATRARDTTLSDFRVGKGDFASLYEAEVMLLELERGARTAAIETRIQEALVRAIIGEAPSGGER